MKRLLRDIQTLIKNNLNYLRSVEVIPEESFVPESAGFPAVGLVEGGTEREYLPKQLREILHVSIFVFQAIAREDESSIMGDGKEKGVLEITSDLLEVLKIENFPDFYDIEVLSLKPSKVLTKDFENFLISKEIEARFYRIKEVP